MKHCYMQSFSHMEQFVYRANINYHIESLLRPFQTESHASDETKFAATKFLNIIISLYACDDAAFISSSM